MNNVFVYLEIEGTTVADVSLELLTKGRKLANQLGCQLEAVAAGNNLVGIEKQELPFGVDKVHGFEAPASVLPGDRVRLRGGVGGPGGPPGGRHLKNKVRFFDFRGADFDITKADAEGTYQCISLLRRTRQGNV